MKGSIELRCSRELAVWLGALVPTTMGEHRAMRDAGHLRVRDAPRAICPLFWPWAINRAQEVTSGSSQ